MRAVDLLEELEDSTFRRRQLASAFQDISIYSNSLGDYRATVEYGERAVKLLRMIVKECPASVIDKVELASFHLLANSHFGRFDKVAGLAAIEDLIKQLCPDECEL